MFPMATELVTDLSCDLFGHEGGPDVELSIAVVCLQTSCTEWTLREGIVGPHVSVGLPGKVKEEVEVIQARALRLGKVQGVRLFALGKREIVQNVYKDRVGSGHGGL